MRRSIFRTCFLVGLLALALSTALFFTLRYREARNETYAALRQEAAYAEQGLMLSGEPYLHALGDVNRVTWIRADGSVIYDNEFDAPANQGRFAEVRRALAEGEGQGIRKSESSGLETMYYARLCADGTVLRLSRPLSAVRTALIAVSPAAWVVLLTLLLSLGLSWRASRSIVLPINEMNLERADAAPYPELTPLVERIAEQKRTRLRPAGRRREERPLQIPPWKL